MHPCHLCCTAAMTQSRQVVTFAFGGSFRLPACSPSPINAPAVIDDGALLLHSGQPGTIAKDSGLPKVGQPGSGQTMSLDELLDASEEARAACGLVLGFMRNALGKVLAR
jgi:hypothetical protein